MVFRGVLFGLMFAAPVAQAADLTFCWTGANGYTMTGRMQYSAPADGSNIITEQDVTLFKIAGFQNGELLGTWNKSAMVKGSTWHLRFDIASQSFQTGGSFPTGASQGWNANGDVSDCGNPGFGFNAGNHAQDVCVNGTWIEASSIPSATPLKAVRTGVSFDCAVTTLTSKSRQTNHSD